MKLNIRGKLFAVSLGAHRAVAAGGGALSAAGDRGEPARSHPRRSLRAAGAGRRARRGGLDRPRSRALGRAGRRARAARARARHLHRRRRASCSAIPRSRWRRSAHVENHRDRPEVAAALAGGQRFVDPLQRHRARAPHVRGRPAAAARRARAARRGWRCRSTRSTPRSAGCATSSGRRCGLALIVAVVAVAAPPRRCSRARSRRMTEAARRMAAGDLGGARRARPAPTRSPSWDARSTRWRATSPSTLTALRAERDLLEADPAVDAARACWCSIEESRMLLVNPALRATLLARPDAEGRAALELIRNAELQSILERARRRRRAGHRRDRDHRPASRGACWSTRRSLPRAERQAAGLLAVFVDVTEIRRLETLRKDFVANVSHELRTPITAVRSAVETLRLTLARRSGARRSASSTSSTATPSGWARWSRICSICRASSPRSTGPRSTPVPLRTVADQVADAACARASRRSRSTSANEIPADLPTARADRARARAGVHQPARQRRQVLRRRRARSACARGTTAARRCASRSPTPAPASSRATCRACSSASTASTAAARATWAAPAWGSRSSSTWSRRWAATIGVESTPGRGSHLLVHAANLVEM